MDAAQAVNGINWDMVGAMAGVMAMIGALILAATKSIFITKKEFKEHAAQIEQLDRHFNKKLYDSKNITIFMPREECEKCRAGVKTLTNAIVPREEWEKSKAYRERRMDENQRIVCGKIDKITESVVAMKNEQGDTNELLSALRGSFETYLELTKNNQRDIQG